MIHCKNCGTEAMPEQQFCADCGVAIGEVKTHSFDDPPVLVPYRPRPDPMIDRVMGDRFKITNVVGWEYDGGFYTAVDTRTAERVTVRVFFYGNRETEATLGPRIEAQTDRLRKLHSPSYVHVRRIVREPDLLAVILDWSGTATLDSYIRPPSNHRPETATHQPRQREISLRLLRDLLEQIFDGVAAMHSTGQVNGYITRNHILVEDDPNAVSPRIRLCPLGSKYGSASHHPDRFHYDDDTLSEIADVWSLGTLVASLDFTPITSRVMDKIAPVITQATLDSRTRRIQTVRELKQGLAPLFRE